jgi:antitoxin (DNA-binding transcriptional repressor) of toxin-antitoxin stability system
MSRGGEAIVVTERGRSVARIVPVRTSSPKRALESILREESVRWRGGKPRGASRRPVIRGRTLADMVMKDRRCVRTRLAPLYYRHVSLAS